MNLNTLLTSTILATVTLTSGAAVRPHSKTIVVESPESLPVLSLNDAEAMYLFDTNDGQTLLYVEADNGHTLNTLDVTDPANIQRVARTSIPATSAFDFVKPIGGQTVLIRYRDGSGLALLSFTHYKKPVLAEAAAIDNNDVSESLGQRGLLLTSNKIADPLVNQPSKALRNYKVVDTANPVRPALLATVSDVQQRLTKNDTGTLFLLNRAGITVVRRLNVEQEHQAELDQMKGN